MINSVKNTLLNKFNKSFFVSYCLNILSREKFIYHSNSVNLYIGKSKIMSRATVFRSTTTLTEITYNEYQLNSAQRREYFSRIPNSFKRIIPILENTHRIRPQNCFCNFKKLFKYEWRVRTLKKMFSTNITISLN